MDQLLEQVLEQLRGIWLRRFWGLGAAWLVAVGGLAAALFIPPQYEASTRVFVDTESVLKPLMEGLAVQPNIDQQVDVLASTLMSRPNLEKLIQLAELDRDVKTDKDQIALIDRVARNVKLTGSRDNLFLLSYRDTDPQRAQRTVETLLSIFVTSGLSNKRRDTDKAQVFLEGQIKEYEGQLSDAERRLKDFKLQNIDHLATTQDMVGTMVALGSDIDKVRTELRAAEQRRDALRKQLEGEGPVFLSGSENYAAGASAPVGGIGDLDSRIDALRRNLDELRRKYTDQHPDVIGTRRILADLEKQREAMLEAGPGATPEGSAPSAARREYNPVYQQIKVTLADAEANVAGLRARMSEMENQYNRMRTAARLKPELEEELGQLNRDYTVQKSKYEQLVTRRESAKLTGELDQSASMEFRVIDPPRVSNTPVAPNRLRLILATLVLSVGAGVAASLVMNRAFPTISTTKELRTIAHTSVLGSISYQYTPAMVRNRKRNNVAFAGGVTALCALFGVALTVLLATARVG